MFFHKKKIYIVNVILVVLFILVKPFGQKRLILYLYFIHRKRLLLCIFYYVFFPIFMVIDLVFFLIGWLHITTSVI